LVDATFVAAVATMPGGIGAIPSDNLQLTMVVVLSPPDERSAPVNLSSFATELQ